MKFNYKKFALISLAAASLFATGCSKDYLETKPSSNVTTEDLISNTTGLNTLLNGLNTLFTDPGASFDGRAYDWGQKSIDMGLDLMGEDIVGTGSGYDWFIYYYQYVSTEAANYWMPYHLWRFYYRIINNANLIIKGSETAIGPDSEKKNIRAQALTYRAYAYFKLVNAFSEHIQSTGGAQSMGVPIYTLPTEGNTEFNGRGVVQDVYDRIYQDIEDARLDFATSGIIRVNKSQINANVLEGVAARVYLTAGRNADAINAAQNARAGTGLALMEVSELTRGFNSSLNSEFIWSSQLTQEQNNARGLSNFMSWMDEEVPGYANVGAVRSITESLYRLIDANDGRKAQFKDGTGFFRQAKFGVIDKSGYDYQDVLMRVAEMYLIEAEAEARINATSANAANVLNELMAKRQPGYDAVTAVADRNVANANNNIAKQYLGLAVTDTWTLLEEVKLQRKIELWGEGFSYDDVRRYQKGLNRPRNFSSDHSPSTAVVTRLSENDKKFIFRIPQNELDNNTKVVQNP